MDRFFQYINTFPLPLWLAMMFAPHHRFTERAARNDIIFIIASANYLISLMVGLVKGNRVENPVDLMSLDGIQKLIGSRPGVLGAWSHMLALDLFTGAWIYRQCMRLNAPAWIRIPALFFSLMTGPFGLMLFLLWRLKSAPRSSFDSPMM